MCLFSHTFYCCYKPLPLHWVFAVLWSFPFFLCSFFLIFNFLNLLLVFLHLFLYLLFLLFFSPCLIFNTYKSYSFTSTELCISILSFFPFLSTYLLVLFSLLYSPIGTLLQFCFPVCALVSFVLLKIFGFLIRWIKLLYFIFVGFF